MLRAIKGFEELYKISSDGKVFSVKRNRYLKGGIEGGGYRFVMLRNNGTYKTQKVARLVAQHYIPNPDNKPCVNHIDGIKLHNNVENLEWVTYRENRLHAFRIGLVNHQHNPRLGSRKRIVGIKNGMGYAFLGIAEAAKEMGMAASGISFCLHGRYKTSGGYIWKFA
jgi:hypothetical protein